MKEIYVVTDDRYKAGGDEVTYEELTERIRRVSGSVKLEKEISGVYETSHGERELVAVPKEFYIQE